MSQAKKNCGSDVQSSLCCAVCLNRPDCCPDRVSNLVLICFVSAAVASKSAGRLCFVAAGANYMKSSVLPLTWVSEKSFQEKRQERCSLSFIYDRWGHGSCATMPNGSWKLGPWVGFHVQVWNPETLSQNGSLRSQNKKPCCQLPF